MWVHHSLVIITLITLCSSTSPQLTNGSGSSTNINTTDTTESLETRNVDAARRGSTSLRALIGSPMTLLAYGASLLIGGIVMLSFYESPISPLPVPPLPNPPVGRFPPEHPVWPPPGGIASAASGHMPVMVPPYRRSWEQRQTPVGRFVNYKPYKSNKPVPVMSKRVQYKPQSLRYNELVKLPNARNETLVSSKSSVKNSTESTVINDVISPRMFGFPSRKLRQR